MALFLCKMCGGTVNIINDTTIGKCAFCGTKQTIPNISDEKTQQLFNRANEQRKNLEFDEAATTYNQLLGEFPKEPEAYWGLCLCKYGIEYVKDPNSGNSIPTCYRFKTTSIIEDCDYQHAISCADPVSAKYYSEQANLIDSIQKQILEIVVADKPYDVFISYKETDDLGYRTEDSIVAQNLYSKLTMEGIRAFFAPVTLEGKQGEKYEPHVFAGLFSSKVMILIGTRAEYLHSTWVKNEWARFYSMMQTDHSKTILLCCKGSDGYKALPDRFKSFQSYDIEGNRFYDGITSKIINLCQQNKNRSPEQKDSGNEELMLLHAQAFLDDGKYNDASDEYDRVLLQNNRCSTAYFGKLLAKYHISTYKNFKKIAYHYAFSGIEEITNSIFWKKANEYATGEEKGKYSLCLKELNDAYESIMDNEEKDYHEKEKIKQRISGLIPLLKKRGLQFHLIQHKYTINKELSAVNSDYQDIQHEIEKLQELRKSCHFFEMGRKKRIETSLHTAFRKRNDLEFDKIIPLKSTIELTDKNLDIIGKPIINNPEIAEDYIELSRKGTIFLFGSANRSNELLSVVSSYRWLAVAGCNNQLLLLSVDAYGPVTYNPRNIPTNSSRWNDSLLRLMCQTINKSFTQDERKALVKPPSFDNDEYVYCLSRSEVEQYLQNEFEFLKALSANKEDESIHDYSYETTRKEYVSWWLRRCEADHFFSECCYDSKHNEYIMDNHMEIVDEPISTYFRPAIWVNIQAAKLMDKAYINSIDEAIELVP